MQKITPFLWFEDTAEEAAKFYTSIFKNSRIKNVTHYTKATEEVSGKKQGTVMTVTFELEGQEFVALNGGPEFQMTPAISFVVKCETQEEVDRIWDKLTENGDEAAQQCGWLQDKFGLSWQVIPTVLDELLSDTKKSEKVMQALLDMKKIDIAKLKAA